MPSYPTTPHTFTDFANGALSDAVQVTAIYDEVEAIEAGLLNGTARLNSSGSTVATLSVTGGSTLQGLQSSNSTVNALQVSSRSTFAGAVTFSSGVTISSGGLTVSTGTVSLGQSLDVVGPSTFGGLVDVRGGIRFASTLSTVSGNVTPTPPSTVVWLELHPSAATTLVGLAASSHGRAYFITNISSSHAVTVDPQSPSEGTPANRFFHASSFVLAANGGGFWTVYSTALSRWSILR